MSCWTETQTLLPQLLRRVTSWSTESSGDGATQDTILKQIQTEEERELGTHVIHLSITSNLFLLLEFATLIHFIISNPN